MKIAVVGAGYVGLVTGVCLADMGHYVTCIDINENKVERMKNGVSPIYEPGLTELLKKNLEVGRLVFTSDHRKGFKEVEVIFIAVGTPQNDDGSADISYVEDVAKTIAFCAESDTIIVTKSTVPVGTNDRLQALINLHKANDITIEIVSNPEFLREGSAVNDTFYADRIVIGSNSEKATKKMKEIYQDFNIPIYLTDIRSAEMIKYASNAFLATKISFINEIANICERVGADVEKVAVGMGLDQRIGTSFLKAGIGYGGSCFPKDTKALIQIAGNVAYDFELLKGVVNVNSKQQTILVDKLKKKFHSLHGKRLAILGLAFKPNTDDLREAASLMVIDELVKEGAEVICYDPIAMENAKQTIIHPQIRFAASVEDAVKDSEAALILTEWDEIKSIDLKVFTHMKTPFVLDGRNCYSLEQVKAAGFEYHSIGRSAVNLQSENLLI
ncbi:UDP-glucose dehydrogenase family protein [Ureibacillus sinduriensis]|uniref:UDP-glucose 6-dehydrogenase n=1 Tax=Ureibacillus sinduriensis BLB-1 = JCM 15800 TaxID=1384057 RepID=A0A0A3IGM7_9BACL|nr:UDP-glucose/GDP-mannose dehydrogenase family protein [Ureibacillus sinduriensis]KGR73987.1 UDP-glucose 6-dehydrogenase [Ureibacillus sinduriensis BLB-1 = JCM 15800]